MIAAILCTIVGISAEPIPRLDNRAVRKEQEQSWYTLLNYDEHSATNALLQFSTRPVETVHFLKDRLQPLKIEKNEVTKLIKDLGSEDEKIWRAAFDGLRFFDPRLAMSVKEAFDTAVPGDGQTRLVSLFLGQDADALEGLQITYSKDGDFANFHAGDQGWCTALHVNAIWPSREWVRQRRCILLLEHIGTKDAIAVLKKLATGHPDAEPTRDAIKALKRINDSQRLGDAKDVCWADLLKEEPEVTKAMLKLTLHPKETIQLFQEKVVPIKVEKVEVLRLLKDLGSKDARVWKPSYEKLQYFDPRLVMTLKEAFQAVPPANGQSRIVSIFLDQPLEKFEGKGFQLIQINDYPAFKSGNDTWHCSPHVKYITKTSWERLLRTIVLLEHIGTTDAMDVLKILAKGHPDPSPTVFAKEALKRLKAD